MALPARETHPIRTEEDVVRVRQLVRQATQRLSFSLVEQTKIVTAASELARNTLIHGGGGRLHMDIVDNGARKGVQMTFEDDGPGIPDLTLAMKDGYTTGGGLGLGLSGTRRLMSDFAIESEAGKGTKVTVARWR
jgi:serine/threonine-protein kinase RsbT